MHDLAVVIDKQGLTDQPALPEEAAAAAADASPPEADAAAEAACELQYLW